MTPAGAHGADAGGLRGVQIPATPSPSPNESNAQPLTLISPAANGLQTDPAELTFTWTPHPRARWYRLHIENGAGKALLVRRFDDPAAICTESLCTVQVADAKGALKDGRRYRWLVAAKVAGREELRRTGKRWFRIDYSSPTPTATPSLTPSGTATGTQTATETGTASPSPTSTETATASPTPSATSTATETTPLEIVYTENFEAGLPVPYWVYDGYPHPESEISPGYLSIKTAHYYPLPYGYVDDVIFRVRVTVEVGGIRLRVRGAAEDMYSAALNVNGQVTLYESQTVLSSTSIATAPGTTHDFALSAIGNVLTVYVDGVEVIRYVAFAPLPYGTIHLSNDYPFETDARIEYLELALKTAADPLAGIDRIAELWRARGLDDVSQEPTPAFETGNFVYYEKLNPAGGTDIYRANPSTETLNANEQLVVRKAKLPNLSPDGDKLAFISDRDGSQRVWVKYLDASSDGSLVRVTPPFISGRNGCTSGSNTCPDSSLSWSPESDRIAFVRRSGQKLKELYVVHLATRIVSSHSTGAEDSDPQNIAWRPIPGNETIAYNRYGCSPGCPLKIYGVVLDQPPQVITLYADGKGHMLFPAWSPDGRYLSYKLPENIPNPNGAGTVTRRRLKIIEISEQNTSVGLPTTLIYDLAERAAWSKDSQYLAYVISSGGYQGINFVSIDGQIQPDTTQPYQIRDVMVSGGISWGETEPNPVTLDRCVTIPLRTGTPMPLRVGTPSLARPTVTGTPLVAPGRLLLEARLDDGTGRWLRSESYYPAAGQTPVKFVQPVWAYQADFAGTDPCDDDAAINVREDGYARDVFYLPDITFITTTPAPPTATYTPCISKTYSNINIRSAPGISATPIGFLTESTHVTLLGLTRGQVDGQIWYMIKGWDDTDLNREGWIAALGLWYLPNCTYLLIYDEFGSQVTPTATPIPPTRGPSPTPTYTPSLIPTPNTVTKWFVKCSSPMAVTGSGSRLNIRSLPEFGKNVIGQLNSGEEVDYVRDALGAYQYQGRTYQFAEVNYLGAVRYVARTVTYQNGSSAAFFTQGLDAACPQPKIPPQINLSDPKRRQYYELYASAVFYAIFHETSQGRYQDRFDIVDVHPSASEVAYPLPAFYSDLVLPRISSGFADARLNGLDRRDHRYLQARLILANLPEFTVNDTLVNGRTGLYNGGFGYLERWSETFDPNSRSQLFTHFGRDCPDGNGIGGKYATIYAREEKYEVIKWMSDYTNCRLQTPRQEEFRIIYQIIIKYVNLAIEDHLAGRANPLPFRVEREGQSQVKAANTCYVDIMLDNDPLYIPNACSRYNGLDVMVLCSQPGRNCRDALEGKGYYDSYGNNALSSITMASWLSGYTPEKSYQHSEDYDIPQYIDPVRRVFTQLVYETRVGYDYFVTAGQYDHYGVSRFLIRTFAQ